MVKKPHAYSFFSLVELSKTLFAGFFDPSVNTTLPKRNQACRKNKLCGRSSSSSGRGHTRTKANNNDSDSDDSNSSSSQCLPDLGCLGMYEVKKSNDGEGASVVQVAAAGGPLVQRYLSEALDLGKSRDFKAFTNLILDAKNDEEIAQIFLSGSEPLEETPNEGKAE